MKKNIIAEQVDFIYSNEFEEFFPIEEYTHGALDALLFITIGELKAVCRIMVDNKFRSKKFIDYLCWFDGTNMSEIDGKVETDTFSDKDFENSIKTCFIKNLICFHCKSVFKGALVVEGGIQYLSLPELGWQKKMRLGQEKKSKRCPKCSGGLTVTALHIFE
jgi:hypothetical protein